MASKGFGQGTADIRECSICGTPVYRSGLARHEKACAAKRDAKREVK